MNILLQLIMRTLFAFLAILIFARLIGKQQVSQLTYYDYINGITLGSIAAVMATDIDSTFWQHFIGLAIFSLLTWLASKTALHSRPARKILEDEPIVFIQKGKILEENLRTSNYSLDDLMGQLRQKGVFNVNEVEFALLETNGQLSVLKSGIYNPLTPKDLNLQTLPKSLYNELIVDGELIEANLSPLGLNTEWVGQTLQLQGINTLEQVAFMSVDLLGNIYIDKYKDNITDDVKTSETPPN